MRSTSLTCLALVLGFLNSVMAASPLEEAKALSGFEEIDLQKLSGGEILMDQMRIESLPRGIAGQACFVVNQSFPEVSKRLERWETSHAKPSAPYFHKDLQKADPGTFSSLSLTASNPGMSWLINKTKETRADSSELNLSADEEAHVSELMQGDGDKAEQASKAWRWIIAGRAKEFLNSGLKGLAPIETGEEAVKPAIEMDELISGLPQIKEHFDDLIRKALFSPGGLNDQTYYWELMNPSEHATINLGTIAYNREGESFKAVNCDYYISTETYVSCTVYQLWPVDIEGKPETLVWRGEFASSPRLAHAKGVERMAAKKIMLNDLRKEIGVFRKLSQ